MTTGSIGGKAVRTQIILALVLAASAVGGYYEVEIRRFATTTASRVKSSLPSVFRSDTSVSSDGNSSPETGDASQSQSSLPSNAVPSPALSKEGMNDTLRSIRGAPSDAATEQRSEYLRRLNAETGNAGSSPTGMAPPILPAPLPPMPVSPGELPDETDASLPSNEEVDSFEVDAEEFDPELDEEVIDEEPIDDADLSPDEGPEDGV